MMKFRMMEHKLSDGSTAYSIQRKGLFFWRTVEFAHFGKCVTYHHDFYLVRDRMRSMIKASATFVSSKIVKDS